MQFNPSTFLDAPTCINAAVCFTKNIFDYAVEVVSFGGVNDSSSYNGLIIIPSIIML